MSRITCFGEVLWDVFQTHMEIGGAPLNVALRLNSLNNDVSIISSVGDDTEGENILDYISSCGINTESIQITNQFKTGEVNVVLDEKGAAIYTIAYPCAWDNIQMNEDLIQLVKDSDAFVFGSLVARDSIVKSTLLELIAIAKYKIFDVNLRPPHYTISFLNELMQKADVIKFNHDV